MSYECKICGWKADTQQMVIEHIAANHPGKKGGRKGDYNEIPSASNKSDARIKSIAKTQKEPKLPFVYKVLAFLLVALNAVSIFVQVNPLVQSGAISAATAFNWGTLFILFIYYLVYLAIFEFYHKKQIGNYELIGLIAIVVVGALLAIVIYVLMYLLIALILGKQQSPRVYRAAKISIGVISVILALALEPVLLGPIFSGI